MLCTTPSVLIKRFPVIQRLYDVPVDVQIDRFGHPHVRTIRYQNAQQVQQIQQARPLCKEPDISQSR